MEEVSDYIKIIKAMGKIRGIPQFLYSDQIYTPQILRVAKTIRTFKESNPLLNEIDFIVNSPGGSADDSYRIIKMLRQNFDKVNIIIPLWAKSAATLLSLGGTSIIMAELAELGPIDAQLKKPRDYSPEYDTESALNDEHSLELIENRSKLLFFSSFDFLYKNEDYTIPKNVLSEQLFRFVKDFYEPLLRQINPYEMGEKKRKLAIGQQYAELILIKYTDLSAEKRRELLHFLLEMPTHGFVIDCDLISSFLNNVRSGLEFAGGDYDKLINDLSFIFAENDIKCIELIGPNDNLQKEVENNTIGLEPQKCENPPRF